MPLLPGARVGPYDVLSLLGSGGMGELYRAHDARLHRDVALKLLPATVAADPDRLARFTCEAQVLAALNHPHIGAIYGIEESEGIHALVLELVEGPTLGDRIAQSPIPLDDALTIARQMADALEFAHEQGIIHRDLKPANVKLRPDGTVKVLDFGLAKAVGTPGTTSSVMADATQSPTFSAHATEAGIILGTAAYMSPEQARGRRVDRRADIWAFGAVLFEMLTRTRPFAGETISDTLAAVIRDAPPWGMLPGTTPSEIRALLRRTLEKDPRRRLRDIGDARLTLEDVQSGAAASSPVAPSRRFRPWWQTVLPWAIALAAWATMAWRRPVDPTPNAPPLLKYTLEIRSLLFVVDRVDSGADTIGILSGRTRKDVLTIKGEILDSPVYSPSGHLVFQRETTAPGVWAVLFALDRLEITGDPFAVAPLGSWPSAGANGLLLYANDQLSGLEQLVWFDMKSRAITAAPTDQFPSLGHPSISPDGRKVAGVARDADGSPFVFVSDLMRKTYSRVGGRAHFSSRPTWRDNQTIVYARDGSVGSVIVMLPADGSGTAVELSKGTQPHMADNTHLVFSQLHPGTGGDLWHMLLPPGQPPPQAELLQRQDLHEWDPALSPDATLLAYSAGDPSDPEIMLRRYPEQAGQWQVSTNHGQMAVWNRHGTAIYYKDLQGLIYAVDVSTKPELTLSPPRLVERPASLLAKQGFDISPDGTRLLTV
jgi:serine/threonine protein kinase